MITKNELLKKTSEAIRKTGNVTDAWPFIYKWAESMKNEEEKTERINFKFPIPEGYEAVTRDGRKVLNPTCFEGLLQPIIALIEGSDGVDSWNIEGSFLTSKESDADLFLRKKGKKEYIVEYASGHRSLYDLSLDKLKFWKEANPSGKIYEATLKDITDEI